METRKRKTAASPASSAALAALLCLLATLRSPRAEGGSSGDSDQSLYPLCEDLVPARIREKYLAEMSFHPQDIFSPDSFCEFANGKQTLSIIYRCIKGATFPAPALDPKNEAAVPTLGRWAYRSADKNGQFLRFVDDDTPCLISVFANGGYPWDSVPALAR